MQREIEKTHIKTAEELADKYFQGEEGRTGLIDLLTTHSSSILKALEERIEQKRMKRGFMPLGTSDDPWNKTLDTVKSLAKELLTKN